VPPFLSLKKPLLLHLGQSLIHRTHRSFLSGSFSLSPGHDLSLATRLVLLSMRAIVSSVVVMDDITLNWRLRTSKFVRSAFSCPIAVSGVMHADPSGDASCGQCGHQCIKAHPGVFRAAQSSRARDIRVFLGDPRNVTF
jgi:hypothetical protein